MKFSFTVILLCLILSCKSSKKFNDLYEFEPSLAFTYMIGHNGENVANETDFEAVKIYSYDLFENGMVKDSSLMDFQNLDFYLTQKHHTTYQVKYDSFGRDFERYATRISKNETHLNYRKVYDGKSNLKEWIVFNRDGQINFKVFYDYNSDNKLIREAKYYGYFLYDEPKLRSLIYYEYPNDLEKMITYCENETDKSKCSRMSYSKYNSNNQLIETDFGNLENGEYKSRRKSKYFYSQDKKVKEEFYECDILKYTIVLENNSNGLLHIYKIIFPDKKRQMSLMKYYYGKERKTTHNTVSYEKP